MSVISNNVYDAREAGFIIFGLQGVTNGSCDCGNPECTALFKHPRASNWQATPFYSDEQFEVMCEIGHLSTGYGVLTQGLMVVDVDARNGGVESFKRLCDDLNIDLYNESEYVVTTGSGGGSMHLYFKLPDPPIALMQHHEKYKGIDFKCNSGFVVGAGSMHKSGNIYEVDKGYPQDITEPPQKLINLLQKKTQYRAKSLDGALVDVETTELQNIISHIQGWDDRTKWIDVGMAIHDTTNGSMDGLHLWTQWSSQSDKFKEGESSDKWAGFGKNASVLSLGTLLFYAKEDGGYIEPVMFNADEYIKHEIVEPSLVDKIAHIDIRKPHGFAGTLCEWVNNQCRFPRENLAVGATLYILSCLGGMRHIDTFSGMTLNFMPFGVAGSATGKEAIFQAVNECLMEAGVMSAVHGGFKSEQEFIRNLLRNQGAFYTIDELGIELKKINDASKKGGASYLSGMIGAFMKVYSKADGILPISGDLKEDIKDKLTLELQKVYKKMDNDGEEKHKATELKLLKQLSEADNGIINPYFCMFGLTTPVTFDSLFDHEMATNGFLARSVIFHEKNTTPSIKKRFKRQEMSIGLKLSLSQLYSGGESELSNRVECIGNKQSITTTGEAGELLDEIQDYFHEEAKIQKEKTGMEAICNRAWEICSKVSLLLAMPSKARTVEDVLYGFAVAKNDMEYKISLAFANDAADQKDKRGDALMIKILAQLDTDNDVGMGLLHNRLRGFSKEQIIEALAILVKNGKVIELTHEHSVNKKVTKKYRLGV
jgi:hypothetical protein